MARSVKHQYYTTYMGNSLKKGKQLNNRILRRNTRIMLRKEYDLEAVSLPYKLEDVMPRCDYPDDDSRHRFSIENILSWGGKPWQYIRK